MAEALELPEVEVTPEAPPKFDPKKPSVAVVDPAEGGGSADGAPAFDTSQPFEAVDTKAAQNDPDLAGRLKRKARGGASPGLLDDLYERETDKYDYSGAPIEMQFDVASAANPDEVRLALEKYVSKPEDVGQDRKGRWWVNQDGKKTIVDPEMLPRMLASAPTTLLSGAGSVLGSAAGPAGVVAGGGLGAMAGQGIEDAVKAARGNYATPPSDEIKRLGWTGLQNAGFSAIGPVGKGIKELSRSSYRAMIGTQRHKEAIDRATRIWEDSGGKVIPPVESYTPESTRIVRSEQNRNLVSYGGLSPETPARIEYLRDRFRRILRDQNVPEAEIDQAVQSVISGQSAASATTAGQGIVNTAQRMVRDVEGLIAADVDAAKGSLRAEENALRQWAEKSQKGSLGGELDTFFESERRKFAGHFDQAYKRVHKLSGDARVIDMSEAITAAERLLQLVEPGSVPPIVAKVGGLRQEAEQLGKQADKLRASGHTQEANGLEEQAHNLLNRTIEEGHALRNLLREGMRAQMRPGNMTPGVGYHAMSTVEDAVDGAFASVAQSGLGLPQEAAQALKTVDGAYGQGIKFYKNNTVRKIVRDAQDGNFAAPEVIARNIFNPAEVEAARDIFRRLPPDLKEKVLAADMQSKLVRASELDSVTGEWVVRGKDFLNEWRRTRRVNEIGYSPKFQQQMEQWAGELAAVDGKIELNALKNTSAVEQYLQKAATEQKALDEFVKNNPIGALASGSPAAIDRAVRVITSPGNEKATQDALDVIGRGTPEWKRITHWAMINLFEGAIEKTPAGETEIVGKRIIAGLNAYTKKQQDMIFPSGLADNIRTLGEDIFALFPKGGDFAMGLASGTVTNSSILNLRQLFKQARYFTMGKIADSEAFLALVADLKRTHPNWEAVKATVGQMGRTIFNAEQRPDAAAMQQSGGGQGGGENPTE